MYRYIVLVLMSVYSFGLHAQTKTALNAFSNKETTVKRINCPAGTVQFARGVRFAPPNNGVSISINDKDEVRLAASCYAEMFCARYKGDSSVVIVDAPACGGGAVAEEYIVIDLISKKKIVLNHAQFKANVR